MKKIKLTFDWYDFAFLMHVQHQIAVDEAETKVSSPHTVIMLCVEEFIQDNVRNFIGKRPKVTKQLKLSTLYSLKSILSMYHHRHADAISDKWTVQYHNLMSQVDLLVVELETAIRMDDVN